ncbi:hypothetical protein TorRG33x02_026680 [Trema orientale]|uniref:Uncharacterized protein n=1 Tax=Trema orientale TaxID=63057 RepID=A0A2P5FU95_TREOI|nr:hypothetical protein TorRG33x02_026680 [Trema orientale]
MEKNIYTSGKEHMDLCLVSKILGNRIANLDGLRSMEDRQWILAGGRWFFENQLLSGLSRKRLGRWLI